LRGVKGNWTYWMVIPVDSQPTNTALQQSDCFRRLAQIRVGQTSQSHDLAIP
jgi:hypothetical protein